MIPESEVELGLGTLGWQLSRPIVPLRIDDPVATPLALDRIGREASVADRHCRVSWRTSDPDPRDCIDAAENYASCRQRA